MHALVDSDTPIFEVAITTVETSLGIAKARLDNKMTQLLMDVGCSTYTLFVSGGDNFRYTIDPTYKGNRTLEDPPHREALRIHLIEAWGAVECVGYEADDACGMYQTDDTIIVGIDKDLLQIPGKHYQWPIIKKQKVLRPALWHDITEEQGFRNFFLQALTGDTSDNIKGIYGLGKVKGAALLALLHTEAEMYACTKELYGDEQDRLCNNLDLLWIWRALGETYSIRKEIYG